MKRLQLILAEEVLAEHLTRASKRAAPDIKKRFKTYRDSTMPIINHFRNMGKVREIDSTRSEEEVFADVSKLFE